MVVFSSCGEDPKARIQSNLEEVVIEKGSGFVKSCNTMSLNIDTVKVSDIKNFISKVFPPKDFPDGVPTDFEDEAFEKFISPLKGANNDNTIAYLSVTHKYKINMVGDPFGRSEVIVTAHSLVNPNTYDYISDDLREDDAWSLNPLQYRYNKAMEEAFNQF
jgi:hypothetical protein